MAYDLTHQNFGVAQSNLQPKPVTQAAAATVTPTTRLTFLTGTTSVTDITPPVTGAYCEVILCFTDGSPGAFGTTGSSYPVKVAYQPVQNRPILMCYDPLSNYWWPAAVA